MLYAREHASVIFLRTQYTTAECFPKVNMYELPQSVSDQGCLNIRPHKQGSDSMGSDGEDDESVESEEGSADALAEEGDPDADADMDADSSGAEEMEDLAGDEARAGTAAVATRVLSAASDQSQNIQPVVLPNNGATTAGRATAPAAVGQMDCGAVSGIPALPTVATEAQQSTAIGGL